MTESHDTTFVLADRDVTVSGAGVERRFSGVGDALASDAPIIVGALPFHAADEPVLFTPALYSENRSAPASATPLAAIPQVSQITESPSVHEHRERVLGAVDQIKRGHFDKIVLSRRIRLDMASAVPAEELFRRFLLGSGTGHAHSVRLGAQQTLVGSSPELLISKKGNQVVSHPLAGTVPRSSLGSDDEAVGMLLRSSKDREEHRYVAQEIGRILAGYCTDLDVPEEPSPRMTSHTCHLGTRIVGTLKDPSVSVLELAAALHPTPALCGFPTSPSRSSLEQSEPDRGFYGGAVGFSDAAGDGEWRVVIRSAVVDGSTVDAHAGGGIVIDSDPDAEVREVIAKLGPAFGALGADIGALAEFSDA